MDILKKVIEAKKLQRVMKAQGFSQEEDKGENKKESEVVEDTVKNVSKVEMVPLAREEVIFRLRKLNQPAILFGEGLEEMYARLTSCEETLIENGGLNTDRELDWDTLETTLGGDPSIYWESEYLVQGKECQRCEDNGKVWKKEKWQHPFIIEASLLPYNHKSLIVAMWWKEILKLWQEKPAQNEQKLYAQTCHHFKKLVITLKEQIIHEEILNLYFATVRFCQIKAYTRAHDTYLKISASNNFFLNDPKKPSKRYSDQTFRKYTQTFKRLLTFCQRFFPNDPSKSVYM